MPRPDSSFRETELFGTANIIDFEVSIIQNYEEGDKF